MKPRHAGALALVGWYLMIPPQTDHLLQLDRDANIQRWEILYSFDSASDCEAKRKQCLEGAVKLSVEQVAHPTNVHELLLAREIYSACIATDDPRLKRWWLF